MNLAIDFGNTTGKAGLFDDDKLLKIISPVTTEELTTIEKSFEPEYSIICSTSITAQQIKEKLRSDSLILSHETRLPFVLDYLTPHTLGRDRIAAVAGAQLLFPGQNSLIIDMGTCITYDLLVEDHHKGGNISPGLQMRFKALNTFTAHLPLVSVKENMALVGDSTENAILSGVIHGILAETEGIISRFRDKYGDLKIVICGGDHIFFENKFKESIFAAPELVLKGLNGILRHNVS